MSILIFSDLALFYAPGVDATTTVTFASSGTWTVPAEVGSAVFEAWGGGGAGGGVSTKGDGGGGGAGGQYAKKTLTGLNTGDNYTVTVAGTTSGGTGNGSAGGSSSVISPASTTVVQAQGGAGGTANNGAGGTGSASGGVGDIIYAGGSGAAGSASGGGGGGGGAGSSGAGGNASGSTAGTGTATSGGSGGTGPTSKSNGNPGSNYGGGGSGGNLTTGGNVSGGSGAPGFVTITYNSAPAAPTLRLPASGATGVSTAPTFNFSDTDPDNDDIQFTFNLYQSDCSTAIAGYPLSMSGGQTGWSPTFDGTAGSGKTYKSSTAGTTPYISFTPGTSLNTNTTYCWSVSAIDPGGSNATTTSAAQSFTTISGPTTDQVMRGGEYFSGGSKQPFYWAQ